MCIRDRDLLQRPLYTRRVGPTTLPGNGLTRPGGVSFSRRSPLAGRLLDALSTRYWARTARTTVYIAVRMRQVTSLSNAARPICAADRQRPTIAARKSAARRVASREEAHLGEYQKGRTQV